jgi:hypothetical protein
MEIEDGPSLPPMNIVEEGMKLVLINWNGGKDEVTTPFSPKQSLIYNVSASMLFSCHTLSYHQVSI